MDSFPGYKKIIVCGSRSFDDYPLLSRIMDKLTVKMRKIIVLSGGAEGADKLGEKWACYWFYTYRVFRPDYDRYGGKVAPLKRNEEMVSEASHLVAFHDGESKGTAHIIDLARKRGLKVKVVNYKER